MSKDNPPLGEAALELRAVGALETELAALTTAFASTLAAYRSDRNLAAAMKLHSALEDLHHAVHAARDEAHNVETILMEQWGD